MPQNIDRGGVVHFGSNDDGRGRGNDKHDKHDKHDKGDKGNGKGHGKKD